MILRFSLLALLGLSSTHGTTAYCSAPNLVIIFIDDLGYADVPPFGSPCYQTPSISQLAKEGRCFTDFEVSSAVCSASRAALLTGCYHARVGIQGALSSNSLIGLNPEETTLAEVAKQRGYATACFGKWHLGHLPEFLPTRQGFDLFFGLPYSNDMWPYHPDLVGLPMEERIKVRPPLPLYSDEQIIKPGITAEDQRLLTRWYTEHAVEFIRSHADGPFFLYLAHSMVHVPLFASEKYEGRSGTGLFGDVMTEVDWSVGRVLQTLQDVDVDQNTLVIFTSDNGPWLSYGTHAGSAKPFREGKGTSFEGGFRVPAIMRWPGRIPAGTTCKELASTIDILPTFARLIGADLPDRKIDGQDIGPLLFDAEGARSPHDYFYYYYPNGQLQAVRNRRWKLHFPHSYRTLNGRCGRSDGMPVAYDESHIELALYDLEHDPGETTNVSSENPDIVRELVQAAENMRKHLGDTLTKRKGDEARPPGKSR